MLTERSKISRADLLAGQSSFDRRQFQDNPEHRRQGAMTPENMIIEDQILQLPAFDRHQHNLVCRVDWGNNATGARLHGYGVDFTIAGTDTTAKAEVLVEDGMFTAGTVIIFGLERNDLDRAHHQAVAATTAVVLHPGNKVACVNRVFMTEALGGKHRLATAGATVTDEVDPVLHIFAELNQVLLPRLVQQLLAFATIDAAGILATN